MLNPDGFDSKLMLSHEDIERTKKRSDDYKRGYSQGYWHQPKEEPENPEYMKGYDSGWDDKVMDRN
jgi:hypothetical protein